MSDTKPQAMLVRVRPSATVVPVRAGGCTFPRYQAAPGPSPTPDPGQKVTLGASANPGAWVVNQQGWNEIINHADLVHEMVQAG